MCSPPEELLMRADFWVEQGARLKGETNVLNRTTEEDGMAGNTHVRHKCGESNKLNVGTMEGGCCNVLAVLKFHNILGTGFVEETVVFVDLTKP